MRTIRLLDSNYGPALSQSDAPLPQPGPMELLIRVHAAAVMPTELQWYPTSHNRSGEARTGAVPGHEFSGVVAGIGADVGSLELGRDVFGMNDWYDDGAMADYCVAPFAFLAPKPACLSHAEAASAPISALTAWQGLFERAKLQAGETLLIQGGSGAVGAYAVQLAKLHGARVVATASARNLDFVTSLGADQVIDREAGPFERQLLRPVDVVFDTVGGDILARSWSVLKPAAGRLVTIVSDVDADTDSRTKEAFFIVEPNQKQLFGIAELFETGRLRTAVDSVIPLSGARDAFAGSIPRAGRGKLVVEVA